MSILLKCLNVKKYFDDRIVLKDINFEVKVGEKVAIVGDNGAGKTTLANLLLNKIEVDDGQIIWNSDISKGYLQQASVYKNKEYKAVYKSETIGDYLSASKKLGIDKVYNFSEARFNSLSGGEQTKLAIANIWAEKPQLLILDEPTNHLDYLGISWLISEINNYQGTVIIISHDRYFIDQCVTKTIELENGYSKVYNGNYTYYRKLKQKRYNDQLHQYAEQEKYKHKINQEIERLKKWSDKGHRESTKKEGMKEYYRVKVKKKNKQIKSKIKMLQKIDLTGVKKPLLEQSIKFDFMCTKAGGDKIVEARNISKKYENNTIVKDSSFYIKRSEKIAILGPNGCGKTTLIKAMLKEICLDSGSLYFSTSAKVAYLTQNILTLNEEQTVLEFFDIYQHEKRGRLQTLLANLAISNDMVHKKIKTLSLGERTRIKIAKMIMQDNNVLILDEPTNHLDLHSREMLEKTLKEYEGTLIMVSHDRYFLNKICNKVLVFSNKDLKRYEYSYKQYMELIEKQNKNEKQKIAEEQLMVLNNRLAIIVSEFNGLEIGSEAYMQLDNEYQTLIKEKQQLAKS